MIDQTGLAVPEEYTAALSGVDVDGVGVDGAAIRESMMKSADLAKESSLENVAVAMQDRDLFEMAPPSSLRIDRSLGCFKPGHPIRDFAVNVTARAAKSGGPGGPSGHLSYAALSLRVI